ncbi:S-layer homology domain-containing protein [Paenibacillus physcomitrellae]
MYTDQNQVSVWAAAALDRFTATGILSGYGDGSIRPQANATRAEVATVLLRALSIAGEQ